MSGSVHKEALADAKKLREVAEDNAKKAILERIAPTVKNMIEKELLGEACSGMEEDILISPEEEDDKEEGQLQESLEITEDDVQLTIESVQALAKMAGAKAEHYGVRSLRISNKIEKLHEAKVNEATYSEKLRQIKTEIEKTYADLQEDIKKNIVPDDTSSLIQKSLGESWEVANNLMLPIKVRQINESDKRLSKKVRQFKLIAEEYGLSKEAKKSFGKECIKLTNEVKALCNSVTELNEVVEDSKVDKVQDRVIGLFKEIYTMAKKFSSLNEEELKIVISGLDTDNLEGSPLTAMVEPVAEDDLEDDLGDDLDDELGAGDELGMGGDDDMDMDMDEMGMYEGDEALDELLGRQYKAGGGSGMTGRRGGARTHLSPEERASQEKRGAALAAKEKAAAGDEALDELLGKEYKAGGGSSRAGRGGGARRHLSPEERAAQEKRGAALAAKEKESGMDESDEMLEISEAMVKQELLRLKKRRAAMNEAMKAMQHSPGGGPGALDNFGGAGRELGGGVEGDCFEDMDSQDLNDLDPVGTGYPVNESEDQLDELLGREYKAGGGSGRKPRGKKSISAEERAAQEKKGAALAAKEKESRAKGEIDESTINTELVETIKAYEGVVKKLRGDHGNLQEELRKSNLSNAKLVYATRLMQNENLSEKKRRVVLEQLDKAQSVREVKKLFTALSEALSGKKSEEQEQLTESKDQRNILGGSSKATKAGGSTLTESENKEFTRWGELAGVLNG